MLGLRKLLQREPDDASPATDFDESGQSIDDIAEEYRALVIDQLIRGGVSPGCVEIEIRRSGRVLDGRHVFVAMVRLIHWERHSAVRLLLGFPILESRLRRTVRGSWLRDLSHFGGVWLHTSGQLQDSVTMQDLRAVLLDLEQHDSRPPSGASVWSVPTDAGGLPNH